MSNDSNSIIISAKEKNVASEIKKKKISFISAIFIVIGSSIGSGIFFKASSILDGSGNSFPLAIFTWVISAIAVIAMILSLLEITNGKNDNLSVIGWSKTFSSKIIYKMCKNFMFYVYLPLTFFFMPLYSLMALQDSLTGFGLANNFNTKNDWAIWSIISIAISLWFLLTSGLSSRIGNIQNWVITSVKFIPLIAVVIIGFVIVGFKGVDIQIQPSMVEAPNRFVQFSPGIGMFISFAAVFFAYDGFYYSAGLQTEMKEPKKTPIALVTGLVIVTIIYLIVAISMSLGSKKGDFFGFQDFLEEKNIKWLFGVINLFIFIGVLGIINSFSMWSTRFTEDLVKLGELPLFWKYQTKLNNNKPIVGMFYTMIISFPLIILFSLIGGLGYINLYGESVNVWTLNSNGNIIYKSLKLSTYDGITHAFQKITNQSIFEKLKEFNQISTNPQLYEKFYIHNVDLENVYSYSSMGRLLSFSDLMANWTSVFVFAFIVFSIIGGLIKYKKKDLKIEKPKLFISCSLIAIILVSIGLLFQVITPFIDLVLLFKVPKNEFNDELISRVMLIVVLIIYILFMFIPTCFDYDSKYFKNKKSITTI